MARGDTLFRQWNLIKALQSHHYGLSLEELSEILTCNKRTVQRDLKFLKNTFSIECDKRDLGRQFWKLKDNASDNGLQLTMTEMLSLFLSQQLLLPLAGTQFGDGLQSTLAKIRTQISGKALSYFKDLDDSFFIKSLARTDYSAQDQQIRTINLAMLDQKAVRITYASASIGKEVTSVFHPYGMVLLHASLYCIGMLVCYDDVRTLKVSRIKKVQLLEQTFDKPEGFTLAKHMQSAFGVIRTGKKYLIKARFTGWAKTNVLEMIWHSSQKIVKQTDDYVIVTFELGSTVEFKRWLLGFGLHASIITPKTLVAEVKNELQQVLAMYNPPKS
ncbi:MAG: WYL domain-containing transcriptional regulator [Phycisphaeraceae bacterium]|nr:WYL domain-containing transcriptional regulator [Phycisphaeraceae bacterium]